jgi:hypothetical protein
MSMKLAIAAVLVSGVAFAAPPARIDQPGYETPARPWTGIETPSRELECRDRINQARAAAGKPELDWSPAIEEKPELLYAVDHRVDGCGVLVPVSDPAAIRQPPVPSGPLFRLLEPRG